VLYRRNGTEDGQAVYPGLDVRGRSKFIGQHFADARDLIFWRNNQRNHAGAIAEKRKTRGES